VQVLPKNRAEVGVAVKPGDTGSGHPGALIEFEKQINPKQSFFYDLQAPHD
jgi:hypothetical protein